MYTRYNEGSTNKYTHKKDYMLPHASQPATAKQQRQQQQMFAHSENSLNG